MSYNFEMKNAVSLLSLLVLSLSFFILPAVAQKSEDNPFRRIEIFIGLTRPPQIKYPAPDSNIKNIQVFGRSSGIAYTRDTIFRTDDNGESWYKIKFPQGFSEIIGAVRFVDESYGLAILADERNLSLQLLETRDGGKHWTKTPVDVSPEVLQEADLGAIDLYFSEEKNQIGFRLKLASSSNFEREIYYNTIDGGQNWTHGYDLARPKTYEKNFITLKQFGDAFRDIERVKVENFDSASESIVVSTAPSHFNADDKRHSDWLLTAEGNCAENKIACTQTSRIYKVIGELEGGKSFLSIKEITPPEIKELSAREKKTAESEASKSISAPGGSTRLSLNRGFDKCTAANAAQMQTWWNNSPFYDANIYISGRNRGCSQPQLTATWVNQVSSMGWGLIPTVVGFQAPCSACASCQKHSSDAALAEQQGRGEADIAIADANNLGLTQGTILYYDMERYDDLSGTGACSTPVKSFLKGWTDRLKEQGYVSGVYGSPTNANGDWVNIPEPSRMDVVWMARWNNVMSVWGVAPLADSVWTNHQRIHQWLGPRDETWGGVTFNIDNNISDAPVAALTIARNKTADFDGDGKTDVSVWRPDTGVWYIANSSNASYTIQGFGLSTDLLAPADFDGDGKTDLAVFRPSDGVWHIYSRSIYRSFQWGANGDIPVPADYNGDGYADLAVFRPSNGVWYIWNSSGSPNPFRAEQFGLNGDKPVVGDYDGDGKADLAVFRPTDGNWYLLRSSNGFTSINFGLTGDKPAQADYDGDGKTDLGIFRDGTWYLSQTTAGNSATQFGLTGDLPATGDFDGDNKSDIAVFRPSNGVWYVQQTTNGFTAVQFGINGDRPISNAYLPQ
jgi:Rv2525c-like, glycoside hydrolase-like domain/FG-GAP-like repeat